MDTRFEEHVLLDGEIVYTDYYDQPLNMQHQTKHKATIINSTAANNSSASKKFLFQKYVILSKETNSKKLISLKDRLKLLQTQFTKSEVVTLDYYENFIETVHNHQLILSATRNKHIDEITLNKSDSYQICTPPRSKKQAALQSPPLTPNRLAGKQASPRSPAISKQNGTSPKLPDWKPAFKANDESKNIQKLFSKIKETHLPLSKRTIVDSLATNAHSKITKHDCVKKSKTNAKIEVKEEQKVNKEFKNEIQIEVVLNKIESQPVVQESTPLESKEILIKPFETELASLNEKNHVDIDKSEVADIFVKSVSNIDTELSLTVPEPTFVEVVVIENNENETNQEKPQENKEVIDEEKVNETIHKLSKYEEGVVEKTTGNQSNEIRTLMIEVVEDPSTIVNQNTSETSFVSELTIGSISKKEPEEKYDLVEVLIPVKCRESCEKPVEIKENNEDIKNKVNNNEQTAEININSHKVENIVRNVEKELFVEVKEIKRIEEKPDYVEIVESTFNKVNKTNVEELPVDEETINVRKLSAEIVVKAVNSACQSLNSISSNQKDLENVKENAINSTNSEKPFQDTISSIVIKQEEMNSFPKNSNDDFKINDLTKGKTEVNEEKTESFESSSKNMDSSETLNKVDIKNENLKNFSSENLDRPLNSNERFFNGESHSKDEKQSSLKIYVSNESLSSNEEQKDNKIDSCDTLRDEQEAKADEIAELNDSQKTSIDVANESKETIEVEPSFPVTAKSSYDYFDKLDDTSEAIEVILNVLETNKSLSSEETIQTESPQEASLSFTEKFVSPHDTESIDAEFIVDGTNVALHTIPEIADEVNTSLTQYQIEQSNEVQVEQDDNELYKNNCDSFVISKQNDSSCFDERSMDSFLDQVSCTNETIGESECSQLASEYSDSISGFSIKSKKKSNKSKNYYTRKSRKLRPLKIRETDLIIQANSNTQKTEEVKKIEEKNGKKDEALEENVYCHNNEENRSRSQSSESMRLSFADIIKQKTKIQNNLNEIKVVKQKSEIQVKPVQPIIVREREIEIKSDSVDSIVNRAPLYSEIIAKSKQQAPHISQRSQSLNQQNRVKFIERKTSLDVQENKKSQQIKPQSNGSSLNIQQHEEFKKPIIIQSMWNKPLFSQIVAARK